MPRGARLSGEVAQRAVRYGTSTLYFLDDRSFPEPEAFWMGGARSSSIVLQPDAPRAIAVLHLRNAPVANRVRIQAGSWREELPLGPGEERLVQLPLDIQRGATLVTVTASTGFRPSAVDSKSRDHRFLGVWIKVE